MINGSNPSDAIESDTRYFQLASERVELPGADLYWMPGLNLISSSSATTGVDMEAEPEQIIKSMEQACNERNLPLYRLYLPASSPAWDLVLNNYGYAMHQENILAAGPDTRSGWESEIEFILRRIESDEDWAIRQALFDKDSSGPDGHEMQMVDFIKMEKRKCESGKLSFYLLFNPEGKVLASVGLMMCGEAARLKNTVVHPDFRGQGIAGRLVHAVSVITPRDATLIAYWINYKDRTAPYDRLGFQCIATCYEWTKKAGHKE